MRVRITPEYPGFVVSDDGRIQGPSGRWRKQSDHSKGYKVIKVSGKVVGVHVIVCTAFHGSRPTPAHEVAHGNGIKADNRVKNLRWATRSGNQMDRVDHGTSNRGTRQGRSKLTEDQVKKIRSHSGKRSEIAPLYGVSLGTISDIKNRRTWSWLV